jgi:hypothetical protein
MALNSDLQSVFKTQFDNVAALAGKLAGNASKIANEVQDMTSASIQAQAAFLSKLAGAKNASDLIQIQTDHAQASYEATIARSQKIRDLFVDLSRDTVKSITGGVEQTQAPAKTFSVAKKLQAAE